MISINDKLGHTKRKHFFNKIRICLFRINHNTLQMMKSNSLIYKILHMLGYMQLIYFTLNPKIPSMWTVNFIVYVRTICKYFQMEENLTGISSNAWFTVMICIIGFMSLLVFFTVLMVIKLFKRKNMNIVGGLFDLMNTIVSFCLILYESVLIVPFTQFLFVGYFCQQNEFSHNFNCSVGAKGIKFFLSNIALAGHVIMVIYISIFFIDLNPFSGGPLSWIKSKYTLILMIIKTIIPMLFIISKDKLLSTGFLAAILIMHLVLYLMLITGPPLMDRAMNFLRLGFQNFLAWSTLCVLLQVSLDTGEIDNLGVIYCLLGELFTCVSSFYINQTISASILKRNIFRRSTEEQIIKFCYAYIDMLEKAGEKIPRAMFHASLKEVYINLQGINTDLVEEAKSILICKYESEKQYKTLGYKFLMHLLEFKSQNYPKSAYIKMLIGYITHQKLDLVWISLYRMQLLEQCNPNIQIQFAGTSQIIQIEDELKENELRKRETSGLDIAYILKFHTEYFELTDIIAQSVDLHKKFWVELNESKPIIAKLQNIGSRITENLDKCRLVYKSINQMNPNHFKTLNLYGNYTKYVLNDKEESVKLLSKASYIQKSSGLGQLNQSFQDKRIKYGENSDFSIVVCSGNESSIGLIKGFNYRTMKNFGYSYDELQDHNVDMLMPRVLSEKHDFLMRRYFHKNKVSVMGRERAVFPMDRNGFIMSSNLLIKVVPNLDMNLRILGFLTPNCEQFDKANHDNLDIHHFIMYHTVAGTVYGVSKGCYYEFGIRPDIVDGKTRSSNVLNISDIFPDLGDLTKLKKSNTVGGYKTNLNTTKLPQRFYVDTTDFYKIGAPRVGKAAFSKYKVKIEISEANSFGTDDLDISILKFKVIRGKQIQQLGAMVDNFANSKKVKMDVLMKEFEGLDEDQEEELKALLNKEKEKKAKEKDDGNMMNRYKKDAETNTADRERKIKERKITLTEKRVPKTIKILKIMIRVVFFLILALSGSGLYYKGKLREYMTDGQLAIQYMGIKEAVIPDIAYGAQMTQLWANDRLNSFTADDIAAIREDLRIKQIEFKNAQTNYDSNIHIYSLNGKFAKASQLSTPIDIPSIKVLNLDDTTSTLSLLFRVSLYQYINDANMVEISIKEMLMDATDVNEYKVAMYYILQNQSRYLRMKHEEVRQRFWISVKDVESDYIGEFLFIFIVIILVVLISFASLFPLILKVHSGMNKVMGLFSYVSRDQLNSLANRCEHFKETYLLENQKLREGGGDIEYRDYHTEQGSDLDFISESEEMDLGDDSLPSVAAMNNISDLSLSYKGDESLNQSYTKEKIDQELELLKNFDGGDNFTPQKGGNKPRTDSTVQKTPGGSSPHINTETNLLGKAKTNMNQAEQDLTSHNDDEKFEALNNFKEKFTQIYIFKSVVTSVLIILVLVLNHIWTLNISSSTIKAMSHLNVLSRINSKVKFINKFTLETVQSHQKVSMESPDMVEAYGSKIYDDLNSLNSDVKDSFHFSLTDYKELFFKISNEDICRNFFINKPSYNFTECTGDEFFTKGLQTLLIKLSEDCRITSQQSIADPTASSTSVIDSAVQTKMDTINKYCRKLGFTIEFLMEELVSGLGNMKNTFLFGDYILFGILFILSLILYKALWMPFVKNLENRIWRAQGMVNMIPYQIISENRELMKSMTKAHFN